MSCKSEEQMKYKTKNRDWIERYFAAHADERARAKDIYEKMTADGLSINMATVYRNLDRLEEENVLKAYKTAGEDEKFYQYMRPGMDCGSHLHLMCSRCGRIIHMDIGLMNEISEYVINEYGFTIDCGHSVLAGLCRECQMKSEDKKGKMIHA